MTYNPYEPPRAFEPRENVAVHRPGEPLPWSIGDVLSVGWNAFRLHWPVLVFAPIVAHIAAGIPGWTPALLVATKTVAANSTEYWTLHVICTLIGMLVGTFFSVGTTKIYVAAARGRVPEFMDLFSGGSRFFPALGAGILLFFGIIFGYMLLIVPGVILALAWSLTNFYVVDAELGPIDALRASWVATKGNRANIFAFLLAFGMILLLGLCALLVGLVVALPVGMVALATIYVRLSGRSEAPPDAI